MRKAQSAMEYLMTYGWAILIVIIVAAALYALGVFTPATTTTEARFQTLGASTAHILESGGTFRIKLPNQVGKTVNVSSVAVAPTAGGTGCTTNSTAFSITPGQVVETTVNCTTLGLGSGSPYSLKVTVTYTPAGGYSATDSATVTGTV